MLVIAVSILSACGAPPSLWGVAPTPTPQEISQTPRIDPFAIQDDPIHIATSTRPVLPLGTETPTPDGTTPVIQPTFPPSVELAPFLYSAQSGDMLSAIASRFGVDKSEITSDADLTKNTLIDPGTLLVIPNRIMEPTTPNIQIMPDAEIIFSVSAADFDIEAFVKEQGGYLASFRDYLGSTGWIAGHDAIERLAYENSVNPRIILGLLEHESHWVTSEPVDILHTDYPMGFNDYHYKGMSVQMVWAINTMSIAYYGWRAGTIKYLEFPDGSTLRIDPRLNAGSVAIQYLFSRLYDQPEWSQIIDPQSGFPAMYAELFGDPWAFAVEGSSIFPPALTQPPLTLPFEVDTQWNLTGGPHNGWGQINPTIYGETHSVFSAIDFAPPTQTGGCGPTDTWVLAAAPGLVVRSENGAVMVDLDGDGYEQTGWNLLYMHIAQKDRVPVDTWLELNDRIGHASCEGGVSTGTHLHFARKYNGEWVTADGPIPFIMDGWRVVAGDAPYKGKLVRGDEEVVADQQGQAWSSIIREENEIP